MVMVNRFAGIRIRQPAKRPFVATEDGLLRKEQPPGLK